MKILLINGSPNAQGNTFNLLSFIDEELKKNGLETQWINIGKKAVHGCIDCGHCKTAKRCVFEDDLCNNIIEAILQADGVIVGSPVYFASANGALCALLDRVFYSTCTWHQMFAGKYGAAVVTRFRSGGTAALERLHKYFLCSQMSIISANEFMAFTELKANDEYNLNALKSLASNMAKAVKNSRKDK